MSAIDRSSPVPLYFQLKQILLKKIDDQVWRQGDLIPSELELQEKYGISRTTVRQTLAEMVHEGRLVRHRGRGTFVAAQKIAHDPTARLGFTDYIREQGWEPGWRLLDRSWVSPAAGVGELLELENGDQAYRVELLLLADGRPVGRHISFLPPDAVEGIDAPDTNDEAVLDHLRELPGRYNCHTNRTIEALGADEDDSRWLELPQGAPVLSVQVQFVSEDGKPVELLRASFNGDRFKVQISL